MGVIHSVWQYVLKTEKACEENRIHILKSYSISDKEKKLIDAQNKSRIDQMTGLIDQLKVKYRRAQDVRYFDEVMEERDTHGIDNL